MGPVWADVWRFFGEEPVQDHGLADLWHCQAGVVVSFEKRHKMKSGSIKMKKVKKILWI